MAFARYLKPENIRIHCPVSSKEALLDLLSSIASESAVNVPRDILKQKLVEREETMSTGIGNSVGVPHTLLDEVEGLHAFVITLKEPIPYESVDRKPVSVVIGLFGDSESPNLSLGALATLGRILRDADFVRSLWEATSKEEIHRLLSTKEEKKDF